MREARGAWSLRGIELLLEPSPAQDTLRLCDERSLRIAVGALLRNAVEASPDESQVIVRVVPAEETLRIEIDDRGENLQGATDGEIDRLFEVFARGPERGDQPPGLGLGLTLARSSAQILDATVALERNPSGGSRAVLTLPA